MGDERIEELAGDSDLFVRIAENALLVAEDLREDYFKSTLGIAHAMRAEFREGTGKYRAVRVPEDHAEPCAVAFVDGGLSRIDVGLATPLIVRAGIFRVKQGEADLNKRETFDHFPLMLGQLKGGLKANREYGNVVRQLVELGALVTALEDERFSDIRMLMLHGPLQFVSGPFFEHWFYPEDYELILGRRPDNHVLAVLQEFAAWCSRCALRNSSRCRREIAEQHLAAACMMAFLQQYVFRRSLEKSVLICGAVERSFGRGVTRYVVRRMLEGRPEVFDRLLDLLGMQGRAVGPQAEAILDATRYNDAILLSLALEVGEALDWYPMNPRLKIQDDRVALFPNVQNTFVRTSTSRYPMRLETPLDYDAVRLNEVLDRSYEYASLLPSYAFPIGLDIVDKYAAIPGWMTKAYRQLILAQYGRLLAGEFVEMTDSEALKAMLISGGHGGRARRERPEV